MYLVESKDPQASELLLGTLCLGAMLAACFLPLETTGVDLHEHDEDGLPETGGAPPGKPIAAQDALGGNGIQYDIHQEQLQQQQHLVLDLPASPEGYAIGNGSLAKLGRGLDEAPLLHG